MDELEFNRLIKKYQQNLLSDEERALVEEWFDSLPKDEGRTTWTEKEKLNLKDKILSEIGDEKNPRLIDGAKTESPLPHYAWKIAATLLMLISLTYILWQTNPLNETPKYSDSEVPVVPPVKKILLSDGSIVWLKGNSTLSYPDTFSREARAVTLNGEALFEVSPDPACPFIIQCGDLTTTVLGTSFNIKAGEKNIEVIVLTGKVSLTSENDRKGVIVLPNERALYSVDNKQIAKVEKALNETEAHRAVAGTEYRMNFEDTRMAEVIRRIEGKFDVKVHLADDQIANCVITADFTGQPLEGTLNMIAQALGSDYKLSDGIVTLNGEGCN